MQSALEGDTLPVTLMRVSVFGRGSLLSVKVLLLPFTDQICSRSSLLSTLLLLRLASEKMRYSKELKKPKFREKNSTHFWKLYTLVHLKNTFLYSSSQFGLLNFYSIFLPIHSSYPPVICHLSVYLSSIYLPTYLSFHIFILSIFAMSHHLFTRALRVE